jgi:hypothetical protein
VRIAPGTNRDIVQVHVIQANRDRLILDPKGSPADSVFHFSLIGRNWEIRVDPLGGGTPGPIVESKYGGSGTRVDND